MYHQVILQISSYYDLNEYAAQCTICLPDIQKGNPDLQDAHTCLPNPGDVEAKSVEIRQNLLTKPVCHLVKVCKCVLLWADIGEDIN